MPLDEELMGFGGDQGGRRRLVGDLGYGLFRSRFKVGSMADVASAAGTAERQGDAGRDGLLL